MFLRKILLLITFLKDSNTFSNALLVISLRSRIMLPVSGIVIRLCMFLLLVIFLKGSDCFMIRLLVIRWISYLLVFFFFQAEDGIRDHCVTGVQTCALPICRRSHPRLADRQGPGDEALGDDGAVIRQDRGGHAECLPLHEGDGARRRLRAGPATEDAEAGAGRSEERRVGKEGRSRWAPDH